MHFRNSVFRSTIINLVKTYTSVAFWSNIVRLDMAQISIKADK